MKTFRSLACVVLLAAAPSVRAADPVVLNNFDDPPSPLVGMAAKPEVVPLGGSQAGKISNSGFRPVIRIKLPRGQAVRILSETPMFAGNVRALPEENRVKFVKLSMVVQTDVTGAEVFDPVEDTGCNPLKQSSFAFDLSAAKTKSIPAIMDIARRFDGGEGTSLVFCLIQQSPNNETSMVTYDDLRLEPK